MVSRLCLYSASSLAGSVLLAIGTLLLVPAQAAAAPATLPIVLPKAGCSDLGRVNLASISGADSRVTSARLSTSEDGHAVCAVEGTLAPSIRFRVELPTQSWTQRYLQTGCGGLCGSVNLRVGAADNCPQVQAGGFVIASTDMGHEGMSGDFGRDARRRADFAYRGVHLTAVTAKALIRAFYAQPQRFAYFSGCSDGGREALIEAQRYPEDFNGVIAGAPAMNFQVQNSLFHGWQARSNTGVDGRAILISSRLPILHAAVLKACDDRDGQADGLLSTPTACHFDPRTIVCKPGQASTTCLTAAEAEVARKFYEGPRDPATGVLLTQGGPQYGSELAWAGVYVPFSANQPIFSAKIVQDSMGNLIFPTGSPSQLSELNFDLATFQRLRGRHPLFDATNPDLSTFAAHGGKLILFHGWSDPHISPINTVAYHQTVERFMGADAVARFERLYLMPGMYHCSGGEGPSQFDLLTPLMSWVENGDAPGAIIASTPSPGAQSQFGLPGPDRPPMGHPPSGAPGAGRMGPPPGMGPPRTEGPVRSRPIYPYPYTAAYAGSGDTNVAASYKRGAAAPVSAPRWAGSDFYQPYAGVTQ